MSYAITYWQGKKAVIVKEHEREGKMVQSYQRKAKERVIRWGAPTNTTIIALAIYPLLWITGWALHQAPPNAATYPHGAFGTCLRMSDHPADIARVKGASMAEVKAFCEGMDVTIK